MNCLLSPDSGLSVFLTALCLTLLLGLPIAAVIIWRAWRRIAEIVNTDSLATIFPDRADHMRRTRQ